MAKSTNITINDNNYFHIYRKIGEKIDGTPIRKNFYGKSKKEAEQKYEEYMKQIQQGAVVDYDKARMIDIFKPWLFNIKRVAVETSTFVKYEGDFRLYIQNADFIGYKLHDIRKMHVQTYYNDLFEKGKTTQKIKAINKLLHSFFNYAVDEGYCMKNPCDRIIIPNTSNSHENEKLDTFSEEEINYILDDFKGNKCEYVIWIACFTGMRERRNSCP